MSTKQCKHEKLPPVEFDAEAAKLLSDIEIRKRWPRGDSVCPTCKARVIRYASAMHYVAGDW